MLKPAGPEQFPLRSVADERRENLVEFLDRHRAPLDLTIDEEGRRRTHSEFLRRPVSHRIHGVIDLLVFQAGLETFL